VAQFSLVRMTPPILLAVPNVSEGREQATLAAIGKALTPQSPATGAADEVRLLDVHSDRDHHRSVFTLAGAPAELVESLLRGAAAAIGSIDVISRGHASVEQAGAHPHVGAIDVVPLVYLDAASRGLACAHALVLGERIGSELDVPVFVYGELAGGAPERTRASLRRGGVAGLAARMAGTDGSAGPLRADFGPQHLHPSAGATLVAARQPLVAFNFQLQAPADLAEAKRIAALIREGGVAQVSMNVERPLELALVEVLHAVQHHAPVASAELVGLAPRAALAGFPEELLTPAFDPARHLIENALGS
jgi:glutamate formiminotransferase